MLRTFLKETFKQILEGNLDVIRYLKYYKKWKDSLNEKRNSISDQQPWLTFPAISYLDNILKPTDKIFEFGGGGSTLFFLNRVKEVVTVEHDEKWFEILKQHIAKDKQIGWTGKLILPEQPGNYDKQDPSDPDQYLSGDESFHSFTFKNYASFIDQYPDNYFDLVLVDGRARPASLKHSLTKIRKGGLLVLDNAERKYYLEKTAVLLSDFTLVLDKLTPVPYAKIFSQTNIWIKK